MKGGGPRLTRWALVLQPFSFDVRFRPGNTNANADGLSRQDWPEEQQQRQTLPEIPLASLIEKGGGVETMPQPLQPTDSHTDIVRAIKKGLAETTCTSKRSKRPVTMK